MKLESCTDTPRLIAESIEQLVRLRTGGMIRDLRVEFHDGEVFLTGRTTTYYNKQLATHAVLSVSKDVVLVNDIEVS